MSIDRSYIDSLNSEQISFSADFLEATFVNEQSDLDYSEPFQLQTIVSIIHATTIESMKLRIFNSCSYETRVQLIKQLNEENLSFVLIHTEIDFLYTYYKMCSDKQQENLLEFLHENEKPRYVELKNKINPKLEFANGIVIERPQININELEKEVSYLLQSNINPEHTISETEIIAKLMLDKYKEHDLNLFIKHYFKQFLKNQFPLKSKENFLIYLKFFHCAVLFLLVFPDLENRLLQIIDQFIIKCSDLPSSEWRCKIINQCPHFIIKLTLQQLMQYEQIPSMSIRNIFCKVFKEIKANLNNPFTNHIQAAYDQL